MNHTQRKAYKTAFVPLCNVEGCKKLASYSVFGSHGTHFGDYCEMHADNKLRVLGVEPEPSEGTSHG